MKNYFKINNSLLLIILVLLAACGPSPEEIAKNKFEKANELYTQKHFNDAKILLDSIIEGFPGEIEYVTRAEDLMRTIKIGEQERNLTFFDSILNQKNEELKVLMKNFRVSKEYGSKEILIHRRQKPQNSYARTYIRAHLDLEGNFYISSRYSGENYINHNKIKSLL